MGCSSSSIIFSVHHVLFCSWDQWIPSVGLRHRLPMRCCPVLKEFKCTVVSECELGIYIVN